MELSVELKFEDNADLELDSEAAQSMSGQLSSHIAALSGSHFRVLIGKLARIIWDRNGAIASRDFNYTKFLHYNPDVDRRGHDPAVTIISKTKVNEADQKTLEYNSKLHRHFWIVLIPDRESGFLISCPPKYTRCAPFGRAARQMVAYDLKRSRFIFVTAKDYWRPVGSDRERDIYETFVGKNSVLHIRDNITITDQLRDEFSTCEMVALRNYRLSLSEVGRGVTEFKSSREFVKAIADAMKAHDAAFFDAGILHRDISVRNVIITAQGEGVLIDWDLCAKDDNVAAHRLKQTGTWQFMSAALLFDPHLKQGMEDGRESAFYLLLYLGLRYTKHNQVLEDLKSYMEIFNYVTFARNNVAKGGELKMGFLTSYGRAEALTFQCSPLNNLIEELLTTFSVRYMRKPSAAAFARYETLKRNPNIPPEAFVDHPAAQYKAHKKNLGERGWLVNVIHEHLDDADWPTADAAELNPTSRK